MNNIILVGRAAGIPAIHYYDSGSLRANVDLLTDSRDHRDRFPLELWGKQAQAAFDLIRPGSLISVAGHLRLAPAVTVCVDRLEVLGPPAPDIQPSAQQP